MTQHPRILLVLCQRHVSTNCNECCLSNGNFRDWISQKPERVVERGQTHMMYLVHHYYGNTGCGFFKRGLQNYKDLSIRINIPKGNY